MPGTIRNNGVRNSFGELIPRLILTLVCSCLSAVTILAQDFQKSYPLGQNGSISIGNVSGNIIVSGRAPP